MGKQVGVKCVRGYISHDDCRRCAQDPLHPCELTPDILEEFRAKDGDRHHDPDSFSPSYILDCHRKASIMGDVDHYLDVEHAWALVRGTMIHARMEKADYPGALGVMREIVFQTEVDTAYGYKQFFAQPDLIVLKAIEEDGSYRVKVVDYKSTGEVGHDLIEAKPDHVRQINMYRWVVERELPKLLKGKPRVIVDELEIFYGDMKKPRRFTSAGPLKTRGKMLTRTPRTYATLDLAPIPMPPIEDIEAWVIEQIEAKISAMYVEMPPILEGDAAWRCIRCPIREACMKLHEELGI